MNLNAHSELLLTSRSVLGKKKLQSKAGISTDDTEQRIKGRKFPQLSIFVRNRDFLGSFSRWKN